MNRSPVCCEPCEDLRYCRPDRNCCLECHFTYEEALALPHLPPAFAQRILDEHAWLEANGYPADALARHSEWEERLFRHYCPTEVCRMIEEDHRAYADGQLPSREAIPGRIAAVR